MLLRIYNFSACFIPLTELGSKEVKRFLISQLTHIFSWFDTLDCHSLMCAHSTVVFMCHPSGVFICHHSGGLVQTKNRFSLPSSARIGIPVTDHSISIKMWHTINESATKLCSAQNYDCTHTYTSLLPYPVNSQWGIQQSIKRLRSQADVLIQHLLLNLLRIYKEPRDIHATWNSRRQGSVK